MSKRTCGKVEKLVLQHYNCRILGIEDDEAVNLVALAEKLEAKLEIPVENLPRDVRRQIFQDNDPKLEGPLHGCDLSGSLQDLVSISQDMLITSNVSIANALTLSQGMGCVDYRVERAESMDLDPDIVEMVCQGGISIIIDEKTDKSLSTDVTTCVSV